jgi:hypothetical protein
LTIILALAVLTACTGLKPAPLREILDEQTGNTLLVVAAPLVFARERSDVAAHARDYATLVGAEIDQSGTYSEYLLLYRWSTVDRRMSAPPDPDAGTLRILADGRAIDLVPLEKVPIGLSRRRELYMPEHADFVAHAYHVDVTTLRFIAMSRDLSVIMPLEPLSTPFTMWKDARKALEQFLQGAAAL